MGKRAKEHRKRVAARNQKVQAAYRKAEAVVGQYIELAKKQQELEEAKHSAPTLPYSPQTAIQAALSEKYKKEQDANRKMQENLNKPFIEY